MTDDPLALPDYVAGGSVALTDTERWPGLSTGGRERLRAVEQHPDAPAWVHRTGHRLTVVEQQRATAQLPTDDWLPAHLAVARDLLTYGDQVGPLARLGDFPLRRREDLVDDIAGFVPVGADLARVLHGTSSGSTGAALVIPDDPDELARGFHWLVGVVRSLGRDWHPDPARLGLLHVVHQHQAFTYVSVLPAFGESLMARVNLAFDPAQRLRFLRDLDPQVVTGSPASLEQLLDPDLVACLRPLALVSGAMALSASLRAALESAYGVPVIDVYGLHETRPVAISTDGGPFVVVDRRVHVEVLDAAGDPVAPGELGEVVVTAGENAFLPLVRYRTGDHARLVEVHGRPALADLEGREAVSFVRADGHAVPAVDLTQQLQSAGARGWTVHQHPDGRVEVTIAGGAADRVRIALGHLLDRPVEVRVVARIADLGPGKPRRYRSDA